MGGSLGLRRRLLRQFLLLGLLPVVALAALAVLLLVPALVAHGEERNRELATSVREQVRLELFARQRAAEQLAAEIRQGSLAEPAITDALQTLVTADRFLFAAYLTDARGTVTHVALQPASPQHVADLLGLDESAKPHFQQAASSRLATWSQAFLSTISGQITVVLAVPAGSGQLMVEFSLAGLSQSLAELDMVGQTHTVVLDGAGRIIGHADARRALRQDSLREIPLVLRAIAGHAEAGRIMLDGSEQLAYALPVKPVGWTILVSQATASVLKPLLRLAWVLALIVAATLAVAAAAAWGLSRRGGDEVERLAESARAAAYGELAAVSPGFDTAEFAEVWTRLRKLFDELHGRDQQTRAARARLQAVLDAATEVAIVTTDTAGRVTMFSAGARKMLQREPAEVVGLCTAIIWHDADELDARGAELTARLGRPVAGFDVLVALARESGSEVRDWTLARADGQRLQVSLAMTSLRDPDGALEGFLGVAIDITDRRRAEALELARRSAEAANQAKTEFLSRMSHELRSPLNAMLGYAQLIEIDTQEPPGPGQRERSRQIQRAGWHLVQLIDDVLDLSRIESGQLRVSIEAVDARGVLARAAELAAPQFQRHRVLMRTDWVGATAPEAAAPVLADATRLTQVLVNLLGNAAKYSPPGSTVRLEWEALPGRQLALRVIDPGRGMTPEQLGQLFQPFNRLGLESSGIEGTGIGLVITRHLVELMHGSLAVQSQAGEGSRFTVTLPQAEALAVPAATPALPDAGTGGLSGRVLYIEDNEVNALLMREILRLRPRVQLDLAATVAEGLELVRRHRPQLVLLDMHLPDAHGSVALDAIRADASLAGTVVIVVSADATRQQVNTMLARGARSYLTKPLRVPEALAAIDAALGVASPSG
ncbi:Histidine kinase [Rubrivivax sp. A210]|uniref:hybrid sensor histidine kinase/response regulator n=1 Tax=Rubrivivax sp. A210 TaxID=2772301 RepID=UPI00191A8486|nr:ATP-binding protein [Rubrivivax sp. A210]CAD5373934.1 Histidine kinase [Rubrivivax sp. A210]